MTFGRQTSRDCPTRAVQAPSRDQTRKAACSVTTNGTKLNTCVRMACALVAPLVGLRSQSALAAYASATFTINLTPTISNGFASADAVGLDVPDARGDQHGSATHYETRAHTSWGNGVVTIGEFYARSEERRVGKGCRSR